MLDARKSEVLRVLVEEYIRTGEPVSSKTVLESSGLQVSSATIRNDLAFLEKEGFAVQPHTSAGRAPTSKAYRYYVDHCSPVRLQAQTRTRIRSFFTTFHQGLTDLLKATTELLADITHYPAVVVGPGVSMEKVRGIHVVQLAPQVLLVVLVSNRGRVTQEMIRLDKPCSSAEVLEAERILGQIFDQASLDEVVKAAEQRVAGLPKRVGELVGEVLAAVRRVELGTRDVFVSGTSQMASVWEDLAVVQSVLELLEREAAVLKLVSGAPEGTDIRIGDELPVSDDVNLAVVSTSFHVGENGLGSVGVIGPMRMDYRRAISAVEEVSETLEESLGS